jgi:hypothetical protein
VHLRITIADVPSGLRLHAGYFFAGAAINLFSRALRRLAVLRWMMPRFAALSIAEMSALISFGTG